MSALVDFCVVEAPVAVAGLADDVEVDAESVRLKAAGSICMVVANSL